MESAGSLMRRASFLSWAMRHSTDNVIRLSKVCRNRAIAAVISSLAVLSLGLDIIVDLNKSMGDVGRGLKEEG